MGQGQGSQWESRIVLALFVTITAALAVLAVSGVAWRILSVAEFSYWIIIITLFLAISAVTIMTFSFVSFTQTREVRHLMLLLMSVNILLWAFLFLLSHPASISWSDLFSERNRNRTMVIAWVLIVVPTILLGSFTGEVKVSRPSVLTLILWGTLIMPITSLGLFLSRDPVFILVTEEGGIGALTTTGIIMSMGFMVAQVLALPRIVQQWWRTRTTHDLALMLAMALWLMGALFGLFSWDPLQVAEILWMGALIAGFFLIAAVQFLTSILNPHRNLELLVNQRTKELSISMQESEFYLKMWTHKIGNFLQGMITYLDILEIAAQHSEDDSKTRAAAGELSREAAMVNRQVVKLSKIKETMHQVLWPVDLSQIVEDSVKSAEELLGEQEFTVEITGEESMVVQADNLLPLALQSAIAFHLKNRLADNPKIPIEITQSEDTPSVKVSCRGRKIPKEQTLFMESEGISGKIALDLDLFTIKLLMNRYNARIVCSRDEENEMNSCSFIFPKA